MCFMKERAAGDYHGEGEGGKNAGYQHKEEGRDGRAHCSNIQTQVLS